MGLRGAEKGDRWGGLALHPWGGAGEGQDLLSDSSLLVLSSVSPHAGNALYSNVLYWPPRAPKETETWPVEGKALDIPREGQKGQSFYSVSFSQRPSPQQRQAPRPCPGPSPNHPISTGGVSPGPGPSDSQGQEGSLN